MTSAAGGAVLDTLPSKRGKKPKQDLEFVVKPRALRVPPLLCYGLEPGHEGRKVTKGENNNEDEIGRRICPVCAPPVRPPITAIVPIAITA
jgi:hypothetical protein